MKFKLLMAATAVSILLSREVKAQAGLFDVHVNVGYGFAAGMGSLISYTGSEQTTVPYSLGAGLNLDLGAAYMLSDHIGVGLDLSDIMGTAIKYNEIGNQVVKNEELTGMMYAATPMIILSANPDGISPYGKFGLVLGAASFTRTETESGILAHSGTYIDTYSGDLALGLYGALGIRFPLSDKVGLTVELFDRTVSYAPTTLTNTQPYDNDKANNTITFTDTVDNSTANNTANKVYWPFSSAGVKVGVTVNL